MSSKSCALCGKPITETGALHDLTGNYYCAACQKSRSKSASQVLIRIEWGVEKRQVLIPGQKVDVGSAVENDVIFPFEWVRPHHLRVQFDAGVATAKTLNPAAHAVINNQIISMAGAMLPMNGQIAIPAPSGPSINMTFTFEQPNLGAVLVDEEIKPDPPASADVAGVSPLDEARSIFTATPVSRPAIRPPKKSLPRQMLVLFGIGIMLGVIVAALGWNEIVRSRHASSVSKDYAQVVSDISQAQSLITQGHYVEAKSLVDQATGLIANRPEFHDETLILQSLAAKPEIKLGGLGYIQMEGQWLPPETAIAWKAARQRDDPTIQSLYTQARNFSDTNRNLEKAQEYCNQALALINAEPVHPHPMQQKISTLRDDVHERLVAITMTAKGYVFYDHRWVTPTQRFELQQQAKGLVLYKGKWLTKSAAFAAQQTDKGLVLYQGKWMTPAEEKTAQGFVQFEGNWITPSQRKMIVQQRAEIAKQQQQKQEQAKVAKAKQVELTKKQQKAIEARYPDAYRKSQQFVKDILVNPTSAQFQPYESPKVVVAFSNGWYLVKAVVDSKNKLGVVLRATYICKLRPTDATHWEEAPDGTALIDTD
ncbi:MAG TPA: FHA domain-containing protein [Tepidisphaeraceae bacterium]|jgi:hypothetical protein